MVFTRIQSHEVVLISGGGYRGQVYTPGRQQRGHRNFFRDEIYENSVSSVEVGMGLERQIMFVEQCTF